MSEQKHIYVIYEGLASTYVTVVMGQEYGTVYHVPEDVYYQCVHHWENYERPEENKEKKRWWR